MLPFDHLGEKMKENVLDVLMYLFQNYMSDDMDAEPDRDTVQIELLEAGFPSVDIRHAFDWLEGLVEQQDTPVALLNGERAFRIYTEAESQKFDPECRGYLLFLETIGIVSPETREVIIDRIMALQTDDIDLYQLKWIVLMVLFNQPGQEEAYAWMEDMIFDEWSGAPLH